MAAIASAKAASKNSITKEKSWPPKHKSQPIKKNAESSTGPTTKEGKIASARNSFKHGLCPTAQFFGVLSNEDPAAFAALVLELREFYQPQNPVEVILVLRLAESEWLRARAVRMQTHSIHNNPVLMESQIALFLRYQVAHERTFYRVLKELSTLREQKAKSEIGFEREKRAEAAEIRAAETLDLRKQIFEFQKQAKEQRNSASQKSHARQTAVEIDPGGIEMAA